MAGRDDFEAFVRDRSGRLLRLAYMYTRDHALAEDLLQTAYARCWRVWHRIEGDPEPYVRKSLVNAYNSWWGRRSSTEEPSDALPDRPGDVPPQRRYDDRDEVWRAVRRLPRQQQAVLVLRYFEDLSEAQIAQVLEISPGAVKGYASKALAKLRVDPTLSAFALPDLVTTTPGTERVAGVRTRIEQARRTRTATAVAAVAVVLSLLLGVLFGVGLGRRAQPHPVQPTPTPSATALSRAGAAYFGGKRLVRAFPVQDLSHPEGDFTWTPDSDQPVWIAIKCVQNGPSVDPLGPKSIMHYLSFPQTGHAGGFGESCESGLTITDPQWYRSGGLAGGFERDPRLRPKAGVPMSFHVRIAYLGDREPLPAGSSVHGQWAVAVLQEVPWDEYPFPTRPAALEPLPESLPFDGPRIDPAHLRSITLPWKKSMAVTGYQQSPGRLTIRVGDADAAVLKSWGYSLSEQSACLSDAHLDLHEGDPVTISVSSEATEGDWYVILDPIGFRCPES
ncbi:SigE family RNA polymerase sigma factor [Hamadaea tsunoensis]|uniref:SigE family RNA polymerase sigma factor n=1 Tax=Hamadaea tsunoensis TaxID=53368 RepID=UPI00040F12BE|nr:SigE family RNA polymerase sigma factor [Hamadaea tsunoensis]